MIPRSGGGGSMGWDAVPVVYSAVGCGWTLAIYDSFIFCFVKRRRDSRRANQWVSIDPVHQLFYLDQKDAHMLLVVAAFRRTVAAFGVQRGLREPMRQPHAGAGKPSQ